MSAFCSSSTGDHTLVDEVAVAVDQFPNFRSNWIVTSARIPAAGSVTGRLSVDTGNGRRDPMHHACWQPAGVLLVRTEAYRGSTHITSGLGLPVEWEARDENAVASPEPDGLGPSGAPADRYAVPTVTRLARPRPIRWWFRTSALLAVIGITRLARTMWTRRGSVFLVIGAPLVIVGVMLPSGAAFVSGLLALLVALLRGAEPGHCRAANQLTGWHWHA